MLRSHDDDVDTDDNDHDNDDDDGLMKMIMMRRQREPSYTNIASSTIQIPSERRVVRTFYTQGFFLNTITIRKKFSTHCEGVKLDHQCIGGDIIFVCSKVSSLCTFYIDFFIGGRLIFYNHIFNSSTIPAK